MTEFEKNYFYRIFFRLEIYKRSGEPFQIFFSDIMQYNYSDFIKVAAFGGDGGNDGCILEGGYYYQIYSPKPTTSKSTTDSAALKKSISDLDKLHLHWGEIAALPPITEYYFVYNDRFEGVPTDIIPALSGVKTLYKLQKSECINSNHIEDLFEKLDEAKKIRLLDRSPITEAIFDINPDALGGLLQHLASQNSNSLGLMIDEEAPIWTDKIQFNHINTALARRIKNYNTQRYRIDDYIKTSGINNTQGIAEQVHTIYLNSKKYIPDTTEDFSTMRYFWMVDMLIPPEIMQEAPQIVIQAYRNVAEIVLSYYFETCDVYEDPNELELHTT